MRPRDSEVLAADAAVGAGVVGIGDTDERRIARLAELPEGSFLWTRSAEGTYFLGRLGPPPAHLTPAAGLTHTRPADWLDDPFTEDETPAAVLATFARGGRNLQRIRDPSVEPATAACWAARRAG
ncbi:GAF domain-containing protein [Baekduia sp. Peel2402]|uniref:GAF domain-containing protein n=1 Tax=Baekduia sp. Peel2402 TaxID=3458296 RepID=UPI00403ECAE0